MKTATEMLAELPGVLVASDPAIDRKLEAYYRDATQRICETLDATVPDMLKAARADERRRIVAWLRGHGEDSRECIEDLAADIEEMVWT